MKRLRFEIEIKADPESIFEAITQPARFSQWISPFSTTATFEGNWQEGTLMRFISLDENGQQVGQITKVQRLVANQLIELEHIGSIQDGIEITEGEEVEEFKGAREIYSIESYDDHCLMVIETDVFIANEDYFLQTWPLALKALKQLVEE